MFEKAEERYWRKVAGDVAEAVIQIVEIEAERGHSDLRDMLALDGYVMTPITVRQFSNDGASAHLRHVEVPVRDGTAVFDVKGRGRAHIAKLWDVEDAGATGFGASLGDCQRFVETASAALTAVAESSASWAAQSEAAALTQRVEIVEDYRRQLRDPDPIDPAFEGLEDLRHSESTTLLAANSEWMSDAIGRDLFAASRVRGIVGVLDNVLTARRALTPISARAERNREAQRFAMDTL